MTAGFPIADHTFWVVGLARSGCAAGALLRANGGRVIGVDDATEDAVRGRWQREDLTDLADRAFDDLSLAGRWPTGAPSAVIISPGVPGSHPRLQALPSDVPVLGEMELGARFCRGPVVAVTGTNGKSTTTEWIAHTVHCSGREAAALGNLGTPLCRIVADLDPDAVVVLEVSSFQLESVREFQPQVGLVLNLAPDHLDRYADLSAYFAAKQVMAERVAPDGTFITWTACPEARAWDTAATRMLFGQEAEGAVAFYRGDQLWLRRGEEALHLMNISDLGLQSPPNLLNALATATAAVALGLDDAAIRQGLATYTGLAHRHQPVARLDGVTFINDTKATNVHAVCAGLDGYPCPVVLIVGGSGKGEDYAPLRKVMGPVRRVILLGAEGPAIGEALAGAVTTETAADMDEAVRLAAAAAAPDAPVLLSPACASFDMFPNYRARGAAFKAAALALGAQDIESPDTEGSTT